MRACEQGTYTNNHTAPRQTLWLKDEERMSMQVFAKAGLVVREVRGTLFLKHGCEVVNDFLRALDVSIL